MARGNKPKKEGGEKSLWVKCQVSDEEAMSNPKKEGKCGSSRRRKKGVWGGSVVALEEGKGCVWGESVVALSKCEIPTRGKSTCAFYEVSPIYNAIQIIYMNEDWSASTAKGLCGRQSRRKAILLVVGIASKERSFPGRTFLLIQTMKIGPYMHMNWRKFTLDICFIICLDEAFLANEGVTEGVSGLFAAGEWD